MGVLDNLNIIKSCKEDIKQAIADKGVDMTNVAFTEYATKISEIQAGGGSGDYLDIRANLSTYYSTAESVPEYAFYTMNITSVNLPNCIRVYPNGFDGCGNLSDVRLPMCETIDDYAFRYCASLSSIDLPNCKSISQYAFHSCSRLLSVNLPNCIYFNYYAFSSCRSLQSINLPKCGVLYNGVFTYCSSLSIAKIPVCSNIKNGAFGSCTSLTEVDLRSTYSCVLEYSNVFYNTPIYSGNGSIYVHAAHLSQFQNATNWTYFSKCLVGVGDPTRPLLSFDSGRVYGDTVIIYSNYSTFLSISKRNITSIDLPNCVTIPSNCFTYCSSLQSVNLPNCVSIGSSAFEGCSSLQSVNLPMCSNVGYLAFQECSSLQTIDLPMCEYVDSKAFVYCDSLQSVNLPMCSYVGEIAFGKCDSLQSVNLPMCSYVGNSVFSGCTSLQSVNLPMCGYVGNGAFRLCSSLSSVNLPMCSYLGNRVFTDSLKTLYIGTSLSTVCVLEGEIALNNFRHIDSIFVPMSLVDAYKSAPNWSVGASIIFGI